MVVLVLKVCLNVLVGSFMLNCRFRFVFGLKFW